MKNLITQSLWMQESQVHKLSTLESIQENTVWSDPHPQLVIQYTLLILNYEIHEWPTISFP